MASTCAASARAFTLLVGLITPLVAQAPITPDTLCRIPAAAAQEKIKKQVGPSFSVVETDHFSVASDSSPRYHKLVAGVCEQFYRELRAKFLKTEMKPVTVYFIEDGVEFEKFMTRRGHPKDKEHFGVYYTNERAIYARHHFADKSVSGLGTMFNLVSDPALEPDFPKTLPLWFAGAFPTLFEASRIVTGKLRYGGPQPREAPSFRAAFDAGKVLPLDRYLALSDGDFAKNDKLNMKTGRTVFTFLHSLGEDVLIKFVDLVRQKKDGVTAIQAATGKKLADLSVKWRLHIQNFTLGADYAARAESDKTNRLAILEEGVRKFPDYGLLHGQLAFDYLNAGRKTEGLEQAKLAIADPMNWLPADALQIAAACAAAEDSDKAIEFYEQALAEQPWSEDVMGPCHRNLANFLDSQGKGDRANQVREQLAKLQEDDKPRG